MAPPKAIQLVLVSLVLLLRATSGTVLPQVPLNSGLSAATSQNISTDLFDDLEELSRLVDISYCIGLTGTGIQKPFSCASRCQEFENFELVTTWNTGQLLSDSCGYIVLSHPPSPPRIILAFRGTYSIANTVTDLSTVPQAYVPYPGGENDDEAEDREGSRKRSVDTEKAKCVDCTVHLGFMTSWQYTKPRVLPKLKEVIQMYPEYQLTLVGHSLGGAVAALASLDFDARGWNPEVTTFGEPRIGNQGLAQYLDETFANGRKRSNKNRYRRVTHVDDPVPLLPPTEWSYQPHAGEIYISKPDLSPKVQDLHYCEGDADPDCIAGAGIGQDTPTLPPIERLTDMEGFKEWWNETKGGSLIPARWIWQLFFAHRDYFWRLGLCVPGGDPTDWYRIYPHEGNHEQE